MLHQYNSKSLSDLTKAVESNNIELIYAILNQAKTDVNAQDAHGRTVLHTAAFHTYIEECCLEALLDEKPNVNIKDEFGNTPLHVAAIRGNLRAVELLLKAGADRTLMNGKKETPAEAAIQSNCPNAAKLINNFGQKVPAAAKIEIPVPVPAPAVKEEEPEEFFCPISLEMMEDPVITPSGITYDRPYILDCIKKNGLDPQSKKPLNVDQLYPNLALKALIEKWIKTHPTSSNSNKL